MRLVLALTLAGSLEQGQEAEQATESPGKVKAFQLRDHMLL